MIVTNAWINKFKNDFETEEQWHLKQKFLLAHKDKYPEDRLTSLAQVFVNVECLGCRYPQEVMKIIDELSKGIAGEYRSNKKNKLQRTFVKASDAVKERYKPSKKQIQPPIVTNSVLEPTLKRKLLSSSNSSSEEELSKECSSEKKCVSNMVEELLNCYDNLYQVVIMVKYGENFTDNAHDIIQRSFIEHAAPSFSYTTLNDQIWKCAIVYRGFQASIANGATKKEARQAVGNMFLSELQKYCFTVVEKKNVSSDNFEVNRSSEQQTSQPHDSIGSRMMKQMGWKGGGLGKCEQGISEPIALSQHINKCGFGVNISNKRLMENVRDRMQKYVMEDTNCDLIFATDFSKEERAQIHRLATSMGLRSKSRGNNDSRQLVVSKKITPLFIVKQLLECGGENDRYRLIRRKTK